MENRTKLVERLDKITVFLIGIFLILFPLAITDITTDAYAIPKQSLLIFLGIVGTLLMGVKSVLSGSIKFRRTPFDLPIILFIGAALLSAIFSINRADAFVSFVPFLFLVILFFLITNSIKKASDLMFLNGSLIFGAILVSLVTFLSYLKIYIVPLPLAKFQTFTPLGSLFDQAIYLGLVLSLCLYMAWPALKRRVVEKGRLIFVVGAFFVLIGTFVTILGAVTLQKPVILPFQSGFQIGFASISQDNGRVVQGFLAGSGVGTFLTDFTRFKPATFNLNTNVWNLTFLRSSSFVLELLATTGLLGILSFLFLVYRIIRTKPLFVPLVLVVVFSLIFPFAFSSILILFVLLGLYSGMQGLEERQKTRFFDVELKIVTLKRGVFALSDPTRKSEGEYGNLLPFGFLALAILFAALLGISVGRFILSDYLFQKSLVAAAKNDAQTTYQLQTEAIRIFPERDGYHRIFSQINLSIANNIAAGIPKGSSPSAQTQQTIYQLIQQSINSARNATTVSPATAIDWQNLSSIYRSLIGFGQNADTFAIIANQQALTLDPNNPQQYINYGGIFYQLGQWDNAIRQFQVAASLKPDFANAYYNLGHALEQKGDLQGALTQYQTVKSLVANDKTSLSQIDNEIKALQTKIGKEGEASKSQAKATENQPPLEVNQPAAQLPEQNPPVKIPPPKGSPTPTPKTSQTPTPGPSLAP